MYAIVDEEVDEAGRYRIRVSIRGCTVMLKYDKQPTVAQVIDDAERYEAMTYPPDPVEVGDGAASTD